MGAGRGEGETVECGRASASVSILRPLRDEAMAVADPLGRGSDSVARRRWMRTDQLSMTGVPVRPGQTALADG
ncbi:hypothetical protein THAOC_22001, partial [Thalassiosira oceanica]